MIGEADLQLINIYQETSSLISDTLDTGRLQLRHSQSCQNSLALTGPGDNSEILGVTSLDMRERAV